MNLIVVPAHLDALFLKESQFVTYTKADFNKLPFVRNGQDYHADSPFLSQQILAEPFHNDTLFLKAGLHLHWAMPDAMTKSLGDSSQFPLVPNRWLVRRLRDAVTEKAWVVESDYLFPAGQGQLSGSISYPTSVENPQDPPFRYLGRRMPIKAWANHILNGSSNAEYLHSLTAVGYGDPTFAAHYPNCHSVFGFYDREIKDEASLVGISYELVGWYSRDEQDFLLQLFDTITSSQHAPANSYELYLAIEDTVKWYIEVAISKTTFLAKDGASPALWDQWIKNKWLEEIDDNNARLASNSLWVGLPDEQSISILNSFLAEYFPLDKNSFALRTLCFSSLSFPAELSGNLENPALQSSSDINITIGNSGTEALSAYLAEQLAHAGGLQFSASEIEDQIEAIQLAAKLEHRKLDTGPKFEEGRHENGFNAVNGGIRWTIRPQTDSDSSKQAGNVAEQKQITLPESLGHALNQLNRLQELYNEGEREIRDLRSILFSDWCKYLKCVYTPDGTHEDFIDPDEVRYFIEQKDLPALEEKVESVGKLSYVQDDFKKVTEATATEGEQHSLAKKVADAVNDILAQLHAFNKQGGLLIALKLSEKDGAGKVPDHAGSALSGSLSGNAQLIEDERFGKVTQFDGTNSKLLLPALPSVKAFSFWVNLDANASGCLVQTGQNSLALDQNNGWSSLYVNGKQVVETQWDSIPKGEWVHVYLTLEQAIDSPIHFMSREDNAEFVKGKLTHIHVYNYQLTQAEILRDLNHFVKQRYVLQNSPSNRFWKPKEPALLIHGDIVKPSARHGFDGQHRSDDKLHCTIHAQSSMLDLIGDDNKLKSLFKDLAGRYPQDHFAFDTWAHQPWNPILLEWEVIMAPMYNKSNLREGLRIYDTNFVLENHEMLENNVDLTVKPNKFNIINVAYEYVGSSILTPNANFSLKAQLETFLKKQVLIPYYLAQHTAEEDQNFDFSSQEVDIILNDYIHQNEANLGNDPTYVLIRAYKWITHNNFHSLSQSLGGFNDALIMQHLIMQVPVEDPIGFSNYQSFAQKVKEALGRDIYAAPRPENDFNPIRSGAMRINQLRLIDSFGRNRRLYSGAIGKPYHMQVPNKADMVHLRPRIVQPARLGFRWLSALDGDQEMNDHPATSPICGWLLANNLDNNIRVFEQHGTPICDIGPGHNEQSILRHPPGPKGGETFNLNEITNEFLHKFVNYLLQRTQADNNFLQQFIGVIDSSLANIDPENHAQHTDIALLMSRPVAITRGCLKFELAGLPAINHDMNVFRNDLVRNSRQTEAFTHVKLPIRLGEFKQLNDGLVGYLIENEDGFKADKFYAPQSSTVADDYIVSRGQENFILNKCLSEGPDFLTMLVDPRGKVHATTGVLPTSVIDIPPEQYVDALNRIEVTFLSSPLLSDSQQVQIPLPGEAGYRWSWLANTGDGWDEIFVPGIIRRTAFTSAFPQSGNAIWDTLKDPGIAWIKPIDNDRAEVIRRDQRVTKSLDPNLNYDMVKIEAVLAQVSISQAPLKAHLNSTTVIREGWLKLKKITD